MDWPHSPPHRLSEQGAYIVTAGTYLKEPYFRSAQRLTFLCETLLRLASQESWGLHAWAVFPNHYHFVGESQRPATLAALIRKLHSITAREVNAMDGRASRKVWFQYWDRHLTFAESYFARLNYVHQNVVRHGLVKIASAYSWCSAGWFERSAPSAYFRRISKLPIDELSVPDDYRVEPSDLD
jgi:putative transposase